MHCASASSEDWGGASASPITSRRTPSRASQALVWLSEAVANAAKRWDADLVVPGPHGRKGFHRLVMGSSAKPSCAPCIQWPRAMLNRRQGAGGRAAKSAGVESDAHLLGT
nr:universal stress protein [Hydrogenophaga sp.]